MLLFNCCIIMLIAASIFGGKTVKKTLAIACQNANTIDMHLEQIKSLFSNTLDVQKYCAKSSEITNEIIADAVVVLSYDTFEEIKDKIKKPCEIIFGSRTVSKSGLDKIMSIPNGTQVLVIDESLEMSKQMICVFFQIGINHLLFIPASEKDDLHDKVVLTLGNYNCGLDWTKSVIDIGYSLLDINTIIEIGIRLNLDHVISRQNIKESFKKIVTANIGLADILGRTNRISGSLDILLHANDDGIIMINSQGQVLSYNEKAGRTMGVNYEDIVGKNGIELFPQIPFPTVIKENKPIKDKLEKIGGYDVVISVDPITHSGKFYGAVAVIKRFSDEERKQHKIRAQLLCRGHRAKYEFKDIIGDSEAIRKCKNIARRMAHSDSSILITGASGTGKEMFAHAIHNSSDRKDFQFVVVNCGALPESILESELFGYEEGAFTGARKGGKPGLFELAHKGTLFLDEIGEMSLKLQMRLLRVLQEREVMRLGSDRLISVDIRLIAATHRNLKEMVQSGKVREDLFYRLNVLPLAIPPLRSRKEDILPLIAEFKKKFKYDFELTQNAKLEFLNHNWKGNVRELRNYIEYIVNLGINNVHKQDLPFEVEKDDEKVESDTYLNVFGQNYKTYLFVLQVLENGFSNSKRLGRRSISRIAKDQGLFLSEQEIRKILTDLEKYSMVEIFSGRSGTLITEKGKQILNSHNAEVN